MTHHGAGLLRLVKDRELVEQLKRDWRQARLMPRQQAMLAYVEKLTLTPWQMQRADVESLKAAGFGERDILDINQIAGYYAYVNRLADGLGVPLEAFWDE
jgi:uncharacterized peroxidase-related enzyme